MPALIGAEEIGMDDSNNLWGGRFEAGPDKTFEKFNSSFAFDRKLFAADVRASVAHCGGLLGADVVTQQEHDQIKSGLEKLLKLGQNEPKYFEGFEAEDIHSFIEARLVQTIGEAGLKLHSGRSRNDQVATAFRLWLRDEIDAITAHVREVQIALLDLADKNNGAVIAGYTHLQRAQPVLWAHWCLAYFEMLERDKVRLLETRRRVNVMPLGSAALAGTSYPIDRESVAHQLGFESVSRNSLDAVSDRDFCLDFVYTSSMIMLHLSRLAEDIILYSTSEFGLIELGDEIATGSSLMPQKKNPDSMELVRGKAGRVFGHTMSLLSMMKNLPLAYNKDMQEDKEATFDTADTVTCSLKVTTTVLRNIRLDESKALDSATHGYLNATELADYLVRKGMPFREAHDVVGRIVLAAIESGCELNDFPLGSMRSISPLIDEDVFAALSLEQTLATKSQAGGTSRERVAEALAAARVSLDVRNNLV